MIKNKFLRAVGMFLGNLLTATVGAGIFVSELYPIFPTHTPWGTLRKETILSAIFAFNLGYFVYYKRRPASAKWIFVPGLFLFASGALIFWLGQRNLRVVNADHSIYWELSGIGCGNFDRQSCLDYLQYTLVPLRTILYSLGAFCCSRFGTNSSVLVNEALLSPMREDTTASNKEVED